MTRRGDSKVVPIKSAPSLFAGDPERRDEFTQSELARLEREHARQPRPTEKELELQDLLRQAEGLLYVGEAACREYLRETPEDLAKAMLDLKQALIEPKEWALLMGMRRLEALLDAYFPPQGPDGPSAARAKVR